MEKTSKKNENNVEKTLDKWLHLQKLIKEEITLNDTSKNMNY